MTDFELTFYYFTQQISVFAFFFFIVLLSLVLSGQDSVGQSVVMHFMRTNRGWATFNSNVMTVAGLFADVLQI